MAELFVTPSTLEVDYDKNLTELYQAITDQNWDRAVQVCKRHPVQAATWVVRHYEDEDNTENPEIMWRFLPLHSACARQPPASVIAALIRAYPDGPKCVDDQGMYALHYACGNQGARDVIRQLLVSFPEAAKIPDPRGMLPIHYLACWGPSSVSVVDMLLVANRAVATAKDVDGNTALTLAIEGDYPEKNGVVSALQKWLNNNPSDIESTVSRKSSVTKHKVSSSDERFTNGSQFKSSMKATRPFEPENQEYEFKQSKLTHSNGNALSRTKARPNRESYSDEEKRDEGETPLVRSLGKAVPPPSKIDTLSKNAQEDEIRKLKNDMQALKATIFEKELEWKDRNTETEEQWKAKYNTLKILSSEKEDEVDSIKKELERVRNELDESRGMTRNKDIEIEAGKQKLLQARDDLKGLRDTLGDLMEQHEGFKKKNHNMNDRLGSLSASLESMMEQQNMLTKSLKKRSDKRKATYEDRQARLKELMDLEKSLQEDDDQLDTSLNKQTREMEAIAAVIAAARE